MKNTTSLNDFINLIPVNKNKLSKNGSLIPVIEEHLADMDTPVSVFTEIKNNPKLKDSFIFESVDGESVSSRYSFIGFNPFLKLIIKDNKAEILLKNEEFSFLSEAVNPAKPALDILKKLLRSISIINPPNVPRLVAGAVGYLGYDTIRLIENIPFEVEKDQQIPQGILGFYNTLIIFDNLYKTLLYVYAPLVKINDDPQQVYNKAKENLKKLTALFGGKKGEQFVGQNENVDWSCNMDAQNFKKNVEKAKEYIKAGDIFQVVLSQRFQTDFKGDPFHLYRALRIINPSPYLYYVNFGDLKIIGSSPELLVRMDGENVYTRPIAGTRPRGNNTDEDNALEAELMADKKELAEHLMLVDLGRNDLGRVCSFGSVHVSRMMKVEKYSHVMHIVSDVTGKIDKSCPAVDALYAAFPAGTLSGAPKIRAMEIIDELEPTERAIYGGAIGYFDFGGNMDWCIAIRTIVLNKNKLSIQVGAGIVADSVPDREYEETINKSQALKNAVQWVGTKKALKK
jgi:anthranilate synthase component 1